MTDQPKPTKGLVLLLHPEDNILIAAENLSAGAEIDVEGETIVLTDPVDLGHKLARVALAVGDQILRYGAPIGTMNAPARVGEHIHSHNLDSNYIAAHHRDALESDKDTK